MGTVELVVAGDGRHARDAAISALRSGQRVLVVLRSAEARFVRRLRRDLLESARANGGQLRVIARAEVVCVDGISRVEAVVVRHAATGRLSAVNASSFASSEHRRSRGVRPDRKNNDGAHACSDCEWTAGSDDLRPSGLRPVSVRD